MRVPCRETELETRYLSQAVLSIMISKTEAQPTMASIQSGKDADDQAVREVRKMVIDICRQNGGGHGGSAIGMAALAVALWKHTMRYNPQNPEVRLVCDAACSTLVFAC
jgi:deoxyxylulose-5-phosphate synthase